VEGKGCSERRKGREEKERVMRGVGEGRRKVCFIGYGG